MVFPKALLWSLVMVMGTAGAAAGEPEVKFNSEEFTKYERSRETFRNLANKIKSNPDYGTADHRPELKPLPIRYPATGNDDLTIDVLALSGSSEDPTSVACMADTTGGFFRDRKPIPW